ncbi:MAG: hypothetical protein GXX99_06700, partial [Clostridiales bacterium]|nr:hypothetical protein [Clostridiales bacterium]
MEKTAKICALLLVVLMLSACTAPPGGAAAPGPNEPYRPVLAYHSLRTASAVDPEAVPFYGRFYPLLGGAQQELLLLYSDIDLGACYVEVWTLAEGQPTLLLEDRLFTCEGGNHGALSLLVQDGTEYLVLSASSPEPGALWTAGEQYALYALAPDALHLYEHYRFAYQYRYGEEVPLPDQPHDLRFGPEVLSFEAFSEARAQLTAPERLLLWSSGELPA